MACAALPRSLNKVGDIIFSGKANADQGPGKRRHHTEGQVLRKPDMSSLSTADCEGILQIVLTAQNSVFVCQ